MVARELDLGGTIEAGYAIAPVLPAAQMALARVGAGFDDSGTGRSAQMPHLIHHMGVAARGNIVLEGKHRAIGVARVAQTVVVAHHGLMPRAVGAISRLAS